jgi:sulfur carrier protein ThiS
MFMKRAEGFCAMREKLGREPSKYSSDLEERRLGQWRDYQCSRKNDNELSPDRIAILEAIPGWSWGKPRKKVAYGEVAAGYRAMREKLGREPSERSSDAEERFYARWRNKQRSRKNKLPADRIAILEAIQGWSWGKPYKPRKKVTYGEVAEGFCAMREKLGREPSERSSDAEERFYARWRNKQRSRKNKLPADRIAILEAIPGWSWGKPKPRKPRKKVAYGEAAAGYCAMCEKLGREPRVRSSDPEEKFYAQWRDNQCRRKNELSADRIAILEAIPGWSWGNPRKKVT